MRFAEQSDVNLSEFPILEAVAVGLPTKSVYVGLWVLDCMVVKKYSGDRSDSRKDAQNL